MFDTVIRGGWVVDGTAAPPFRSDLAVAGAEIAAVGVLPGAIAHREIDASGRYLMPGFVDAHAHGDALAATEDVQLAALRQGVTTLVLGQDGLSFAPASAATVDAVARYFGPINGPCPPELAGGCSVADLLSHYDRSTALNVAYLAPAGTIRAEHKGFADGPSSDSEIRAMRSTVERALADGAVGVSTGLEYVPGRFAGAGEVAAMCAPLAETGGVYVSHMRGYEADAWRGIAELVDIARRSGAAAHASHYHGPANMLTSLVDGARDEGVDLTFDSYPYLRGSSILAMVALPAGVQSAGPDDTVRQLADAATRNRLASEWFPTISDILPRITLAYVGAEQYSWAEGLSLPEAARRAGMPAGELVCELVSASGLRAGCVFAQPPTNTENDMRTLLRHEAHMAGSDGIYLGGRPHPRAWGTFARVLSRHTRDLGDWTWGQAASHLAGHPARRFGLAGRGVLRAGAVADIVVLDPSTVADRACYERPRELADGVDEVLVGGEPVLRGGELTGARPGRGLRRQEVSR